MVLDNYWLANRGAACNMLNDYLINVTGKSVIDHIKNSLEKYELPDTNDVQVLYAIMDNFYREP